MKHFLVLVVSALMLSGCVLQSKAPLFADKDAKLLLKPYGADFVTANFSDGEWKSEKDKIHFVTKGNHYTVTSEKSTMTVSFVPLKGDWAVMQVTDEKNMTAYVLVQTKKNEVLHYPLMCADMKKDAALSTQIEFIKDDCIVKPGFTLDQFQSLASHQAAARLKIIVAP